MKVHFEKPRHGWLSLDIEGKEHSYDNAVSYVTSDFLEQLIAMLTRVWNQERNVCIYFLNEPHWIMLQWLDNSTFRIGFDTNNTPIPCSTDNKTLAEFEITAKELCVAFWRGLRDLEAKTTPEEYAEHWGSEFPSDSLQILTDLIKQDKEQS